MDTPLHPLAYIEPGTPGLLNEEEINELNTLLGNTEPDTEITETYFGEMCLAGAVFLARLHSDSRIVGHAQLIRVPAARGRYCFIEDVIVHYKYRRHGIGRMLEQALESVEGPGTDYLELTSKDELVAAQTMWRESGFEERTTRVFTKIRKGRNQKVRNGTRG